MLRLYLHLLCIREPDFSSCISFRLYFNSKESSSRG
nr:MAG TPA: hypothetical protein [Caudoviricetes sp.]